MNATMHDIRIHATDGFPLAATLYQPTEPRERIVAMIASATGVKRERYTEYAAYLAHQGWTVVTFDYRGIGGSPLGSLNRLVT